MENLHLINLLGAIKTNPVIAPWVLLSFVGFVIYFRVILKRQPRKIGLYGGSLFGLVIFNMLLSFVVGGLMVKREMVEYADMEMYASWRMERYVCRSNKSILHCANDQWGLTKPTQEQIREMYLSTR